MAVETRAAATVVSELEEPRKGVSLWQDAWRRLLRNRMAVASMIFVVILVIFALFADTALIVAIPNALGADLEVKPLLTPYPFNRGDTKCNRVGPSLKPASEQEGCNQNVERYGNFPHLMGTDRIGRDVPSALGKSWAVRPRLGEYPIVDRYLAGRDDNPLASDRNHTLD